MLPTANRRKTHEVYIGATPLGGDNPIRIQSMTNTPTMDIEQSVAQSIRIIEAGGEYVRLTAQGVREAENLRNIKSDLRRRGYDTPLVADIHFNANAAFAAATTVEKVRINPGNFVDTGRKFQKLEYTDEEYRQEIEKIRSRFVPFLDLCKKNGTAIRIGVNHGSLSDRIMSRYGDTAVGMVESCMEYLQICVDEGFSNVVISMKASSTRVMIESVRLLAARMDSEGMTFPLHLGVTEAGDGEDGRIKSAVGIGTLLAEGLGDTIRVSLSEAPEAEIPVAKLLVESVETPRLCSRRKDLAVLKTPIVIADMSKNKNFSENPAFPSDLIYIGTNKNFEIPSGKDILSAYFSFSKQDINEVLISKLKNDPQKYVLLSSASGFVFEQQYAIEALRDAGVRNPIILHRTYQNTDYEKFIIKAAVDCGRFFIDRLADGLMLSVEGGELQADFSTDRLVELSFGILQAAGARISKTEYIACPGCGRTLFDLQNTLHRVREATSHLKGLKIGVMGCIVNGPGEMADADYGYVGAGVGRVSLYRGKECVKKNIPEADAVEELLKVIEKDCRS